MQAAREGLPGFLAKIPVQDAAAYGFLNGTDPAGVSLGQPQRLNVITPQALESYVPGQNVAALLTPTDLWYAPVLVAGRTVAFLAVQDQPDGTCQAVSLGYAGLASSFGQSKKNAAWGWTNSQVLAVSFQAREYFLADPETSPDALFSLKADQAKNAPAGQETLDAVVGRLAPLVRENIKQGAVQ